MGRTQLRRVFHEESHKFVDNFLQTNLQHTLQQKQTV